jgi:two-component system, OmpR family, response regulator MprA
VFVPRPSDEVGGSTLTPLLPGVELNSEVLWRDVFALTVLSSRRPSLVGQINVQGYSRRMAELLIVDDDEPIRRMLARTLSAEGYGVSAAPDGGAALAAVERSMPDLLILDVAMPGVDGLGVAKRLRAKRLSLPILFLTARDSVADRVDGFDAGADDYLVKPFAIEELLVRVRALLRRGRPVEESRVYRDLRLDAGARVAFRAGREIKLTERETALLDLLIRNAGLVVSRAQAVREAWEDGAVGFNVVDRYVAYLRKKLGDPPLIETVRGVGFRLPR